MAAAVSSIERRVTSMTGQPWRAKSRRDSGDLLRDRVAIHIGRVVVGLQAERDGSGGSARCAPALATRPTMSGLRVALEHRRQRHAGHQRNVGGLDAAVGEIDRRRRLRGAADAEQHHVGLLEVVRQLPVIVQQREVHRVDALEIFRVEHVLRAGPRRRRGAEIGLQQRVHRREHRQMRRARRRGRPPRAGSRDRLDERVEHDAGRGLDLRDDALELRRRTHQRIDVLDRRRRLRIAPRRRGRP